ncbi:MAG: hypothetical protein R2712_06970 [Vicinamibacterales bacterium]
MPKPCLVTACLSLTLALVVGLPASAAAQTFSTHVFASAGRYRDSYIVETFRWEDGRWAQDTQHRTFGATLAGGGIEWAGAARLGLLAEGAIIVADAYPNAVGVANLLYRFRDRRDGARLVPFVTGGYARYGNMNGFNGGAGLNVWFGDRVGLRLEGRVSRFTKVWVFSPTEHSQLYEMRLGVVFGRR